MGGSLLGLLMTAACHMLHRTQSPSAISSNFEALAGEVPSAAAMRNAPYRYHLDIYVGMVPVGVEVAAFAY